MAVPENAVRFTGHPEHTQELPHLVHMVMGRGKFTADGRVIVLEPRTSVWLQAEVPHSLALDGHSIALGPVMSPAAAPASRIQVLGVVPAITDLMLARLAAQPGTDEQADVFTRGLEEILLEQCAEVFAAPVPAHPIVARIAEASVHSAATLAMLCERVGMSERQVQRIFAAETGMGFTRWRTRRRLSRAVRSLRGGASNVSAAKTAGFATSATLLRALSRESGVPLDDLRADPLGWLPETRTAERAGQGRPS